jgi:uncharacterized membrane protein
MGKGILWAVAIAAIVIIAGVFGAYTNQFSEHALGGPAEWGMFGDYVGGLANPLLSFLTIFLLIVSLYYQSQELAATRNELAQSKKALQQANQIHANSITIQTRNNLRPQLVEHFDDRIRVFHNTTEAPISLLIDGVYISASLTEVVKMRRDDYEGSNTVAAEFANAPDFSWKSKGWENIASNTGRFFFEAFDGLLSVIEHSDSELMTQVAYDKFDGAMNLMEVAGVYSESEINYFREAIRETIAIREAREFPPYHKKTKPFSLN